MNIKISQFAPLVIAVSVFMTYGFISAGWSAPFQNPPLINVAAPLNVSTSSQSKPGNIGVNTLVAFRDMRSDKYCDENGNNCFAPATTTCAVGDVLTRIEGGAWGCSPTNPGTYLNYAMQYCGLRVDNPGSFSLHGVILKSGKFFDLYDELNSVALLQWSCRGPNYEMDHILNSSCGFTVPNHPTSSLQPDGTAKSLHGVNLKNGTFYDFYDESQSTAELEWSCSGQSAVLSGVIADCGLRVQNPGSISIHGVTLKNGTRYDIFDSNQSTAILEWSCQ